MLPLAESNASNVTAFIWSGINIGFCHLDWAGRNMYNDGVTITLLHTKLFIPRDRPNQVPRPHLIDMLNLGLSKKLILVAAPAGYGKTTLVAEWINGLHVSGEEAGVRSVPHAGPSITPITCWLTLDENDNNLHRFLSYVIAALQTGILGIGDMLLEQMLAVPPMPLEMLLTALINELAQIDQEFVLVLDDFQHIDSATIHEALIFLLENLPPNLHLLVGTRVDPPWPLARLRARGDLLELRGPDLRFRSDEIAAFFADMQLDLPAQDITTLEKRTEGWIAGLQMAALALHNRQDVSAFIAAFAGSHRYILDYLIEEVVQRQPVVIRDFLLRTAVLGRLSAPLCAYLLAPQSMIEQAREERGRQNTGDPGDILVDYGGAQAILERLEAANLYIVPLDEERRWYRYHQLFADTLRNQLNTEFPAEVPALHRRAARWYAANGFAREGVNHALKANDFHLAGWVIQNNWRRLFHQGWVHTTLYWLESLPPDLLRQMPPLSVAYCWSLAVRGDHRRIPNYLLLAEEAREKLALQGALPEDHPEYIYLSQQFRLLRSLLARFQGDSETAVAQASRCLDLLSQMAEVLDDNQLALGRGAIYLQLGYGQLSAGDLAAAAVSFVYSQQDSRRAGNFLAMGTAVFELSRLWRHAGQPVEAENLCRETLALVNEPAYAGWPAFFIVHIALADLLTEKGEFSEALSHLQHGMELGRRSGQMYYLAHGYLVAGRLHQVRGADVEAQTAVQQAEALLAEVGLTIDDLKMMQGEGEVRSLGLQETAAVFEPLTAREADVLRLMAAGLSNREIAAELYLSLNTIKTHNKSLFSKLAVHNRTQAVVRAREWGLLD